MVPRRQLHHVHQPEEKRDSLANHHQYSDRNVARWVDWHDHRGLAGWGCLDTGQSTSHHLVGDVNQRYGLVSM